ncbi:MAG: hypothetical protein AAB116_02500 [Candidatus Poribacteria bacterium]
MSEYQYYEFRAIDRPLTQTEMKELRKLSTRAEITPMLFTNTYNYGDFGGSPEEMMEKYFDAYVYVANWGSFHLMLRFPRGIIDEEIIELYIVEDALKYWTTNTHVIISWEFNCEDGWDEYVEGEGWIDRLLPIRQEIEQGNYASLYIGWMLGFYFELYDDDTVEPPVPFGNKKLTTAQKAFVEFLNIDEDLAVAGLQGSEAGKADFDKEASYKAWISQISESEAKEAILKILRGEIIEAQTDIRRKYNQFLKDTRKDDLQDDTTRRTVHMLLNAAKDAEKKRLKREAEEYAREQEKLERERKEFLAGLVPKFSELWVKAESLAEQQSGSSYDQARDLLVDLRDAYKQAGRSDEFKSLVTKYTEKHAKRKMLLQRLEEKKII